VYLWVEGIYSQTRLALIYYFIPCDNLDLRSADTPPERTQLYLQNYEEITAAGDAAKAEERRAASSVLTFRHGRSAISGRRKV
jgi:hypothetical protein